MEVVQRNSFGTDPSCPLSTLRRDQRAMILAFSGEEADGELLRAMGLREGKELRVVRQGHPCIVWIGQQSGTRLALAPALAHQVIVRPLDDDAMSAQRTMLSTASLPAVEIPTLSSDEESAPIKEAARQGSSPTRRLLDSRYPPDPVAVGPSRSGG